MKFCGAFTSAPVTEAHRASLKTESLCAIVGSGRARSVT